MPDRRLEVPPLDSLNPSDVLVADADSSCLEFCTNALQHLNLTTHGARDAELVMEALESGLADVLILSHELPGAEGLELLRHIHYWYPETQVVIIDAGPSYAAAVEAVKTGAFDYLPKPLDSLALRHTIERAMEQYRVEAGQHSMMSGSPMMDGAWGIVGANPAMIKLYKLIGKVAGNLHPVLILGESGTGKELVARAIHYSGSRQSRPFVPVDCGALVPTLMESELFGHERGAFTGAERSKDGLLKVAEGGTVFFDEIGELPLELQAKLLRALQEKEIRPVGSTRRIRIDLRVIAATNRKLEQEVRDGRFRKDLYFRLNVVTLRLPPLRDRMDDIEKLTDTFLDRIAKNTDQRRKKISQDALRLLKSYSWPGNVRELENFVERAMALSSGEILEPVDFPTHISTPLNHSGHPSEQPLRRVGRVLPMAEVERHAILDAIAEAKGDKLLAAQLLGIGKTTLYRRLREYERQKQRGAVSKVSPA